MKQLHIFRHGVQSLVIFGGFYLEKVVEYDLLEKSKTPPMLIWIVAAIGLVGLLWLIECLINTWFDHSQWFRQILLGEDFIEGIWFNKVKLTEKSLFGLLHIEIKEGGVIVHGTQYDESGARTCTWESYMSDYHGNALRYAYSVKYVDRPDHTDVQGTSEINFTKGSGFPREYVGRFQDICPHQEAASTFTFVGRRITDPKQIARIGTDERQKEIKDLIAHFKIN